MMKHSHFPYRIIYSSTTLQYKYKSQYPSHPLHKHTTYFNTPRLKTLSSTTAATQQTFPQIPTQSLQHLLSLGNQPQEAITKYCAHLHRTLSALKRYFPASLVVTFLNSEQTITLSQIILTQSRRQIKSITSITTIAPL